MRNKFRNSIGTWNLKIFFSFSLGLHLLFLSATLIPFPEIKIHRLPDLPIEVSLLQLKPEIKPILKTISSPVLKSPIKKVEIKSPPPSPPTTTMNIPLEEEVQPPQPQDEEKNAKDLGPTTVAEVLSSNSSSNMMGVENPLPLKETSSKEKNLSIHIPSSYSVKLKETPPPDIISQQGPQMVGKLDPPSGGEIIFARPKYAENPKPPYPKEARKMGYEGEVLLKVEVLSDGRVGRAEVKTSSGYELLDRSALTAVKQWKFIPANRGNGSIPCWVNIPIRFQLQ